MIRENKKLPDDVLVRVSRLTPLVSEDQDILALYFFGSDAQHCLQPLSDLDFGVLLSTQLSLETDPKTIAMIIDERKHCALQLIVAGLLSLSVRESDSEEE